MADSKNSTCLGESSQTAAANTAASTEMLVTDETADTTTKNTSTDAALSSTEVTGVTEAEDRTLSELTSSATETGEEATDKKIEETTIDTATDTATDLVVVINEDSRLHPAPSLIEVIRLFHNIYTMILAPAFAHPAWAEASPSWSLPFPARVRSVIDIFDSLPLNELDPELLRNWFANFVKMFCEDEMNILSVTPEAKPGAFFDWCKYGAWCNYHWNATLEPWARHIYAHRNEWSWGIDGGTRGLAGFTEAVGLWAHIFCRMLEKPWATHRRGPAMAWANKLRLYHRACWEMQEYLYKWAVRVQPPVLIPTIVIHPPEYPTVENFEVVYSGSEYGDEGARPLDQTDLEEEDVEHSRNLPAATEYSVITPIDDDDYYDDDAGGVEVEDAERAWFSQQMLNREM